MLDPSGRAGTLAARSSNFTLVPASSKDPVIQEFALVSSVSVQTEPYPRTRIHLSSELLNCYDRTATTVNANVGLATQGMSVTEILGSGQAYTPEPEVFAETDAAYVRAGADSDGTPEHAYKSRRTQLRGKKYQAFTRRTHPLGCLPR